MRVPRGRRQDGLVTAETAVVLPVLLLVLAAAVSALVVVGGQLRCVDAAREAARAAARGDSAGAVRSLALRAGPDGTGVEVTSSGESVTVMVHAPVSAAGTAADPLHRVGRRDRGSGARCRGCLAVSTRSAFRGERGSATVWVLALAGLLAVLGAAVVLVGAAMVSRHRATGAADLAALAGAGRAVVGDAEPCAAARRVATANEAVVDDCAVRPGAVVEVHVHVAVRLGSLGSWRAPARARAGPAAPEPSTRPEPSARPGP